MKLHVRLLLLAICFTLPCFLNAQSWIWANAATGPGEDAGWDLVIDDDFNLVTGGYFSNTFDMGFGPLSAVGGQDVFLAKYDSAGGLLWNDIGFGPGDDRIYGVDVDQLGNVFAAGTFEDSITFQGTTLVGCNPLL